MVYRHLLNFWPLVPALDLQSVKSKCDLPFSGNINLKDSEEPFQFYKQKASNSDIKIDQSKEIEKELNFLLVGSCTGCLFKTLSRFHRHEVSKLNLYIACVFPESLIRTWLLLSLFRNSTLRLSLLEKAEIFLEILGNTFVRSSTASYIENMSVEILNNIDCLDQDTFNLPFISVKYLKQSEIDEVVNVLTYLKTKESSFNVGKAWENALRSFFGQRYDSRQNLFDYHFNMKLSDYRIINLQKYLQWCESGIAFKFRSAKYCYPNKTMAVQQRDNRTRQTRDALDSFVGDIATSPFLVFGVESGNTELFKKANNEYVSTSADISKYNVIDMLDEFATFSKKQNSKAIEIHFLFFDTLCKSRKFDKFFDSVYISCDKMHCCNKFLPKVLKKNGIAVFETIRNVVNSTKEQKVKHSEGILQSAKSAGLSECEGLGNSDNFKFFKLIEKLV
ncbi:dynein assembly factor 3, axonemal [Trichonephila inaurata madagascariensis]|uniref:Dynein assembly factor 3, axonemal n=1 Tax=Trichonephila inaurata madagascariensis TaxID=2747483 RepID=A0A8X6IIU0_9ARAC|nr:dynein assembly factor 3, axonemal [Trichonephila inaurata madagascariensis]